MTPNKTLINNHYRTKLLFTFGKMMYTYSENQISKALKIGEGVSYIGKDSGLMLISENSVIRHSLIIHVGRPLKSGTVSIRDV